MITENDRGSLNTPQLLIQAPSEDWSEKGWMDCQPQFMVNSINELWNEIPEVLYAHRMCLVSKCNEPGLNFYNLIIHPKRTANQVVVILEGRSYIIAPNTF